MISTMNQIVSASTLRNNLAASLDYIGKKSDYLLVKRGGKVTSALVDIDLFEDLIGLKSKNYLASIKKARQEVKRGEVYSHTDVFGDLS